MGWFIALLLIGGGIAWIRHEIWRNTPEPPTQRRRGTSSANLPGPGDFAFEIVGESNYQPALRRIAGRGEVRHECVATVIMEDSNPHDDKAVRVDIDGETVGYFARQAARSYRKQMAAHGRIEATCNAVIVGGGKGRSLGVWLDLPTN